LGDPDIDFMARRSSDRNFAIIDPRGTNNDHELQVHETGEVELCFDNGFSAITPKTVWFSTSLDGSSSFERYEKDPSFRGIEFGQEDTAIQMEMSVQEIKVLHGVFIACCSSVYFFMSCLIPDRHFLHPRAPVSHTRPPRVHSNARSEGQKHRGEQLQSCEPVVDVATRRDDDRFLRPGRNDSKSVRREI
jgi:hypothetical protein